MVIVLYFFFFIVSICSFYIPGFIFLFLLKPRLNSTERFFYSWFVGIALFVLGTYLLAWIQLSHFYLIVILLSLLFYLKHFGINNRQLLPQLEKSSIVVLIIGATAVALPLFFSGYESQGRLEYFGYNFVDGVRHVASIKVLTHTFPPQHVGISGVELRGYHYFYDFLLSRFSVFFGLSVEDLYFRLFPLLVGLLYGAGFYLFSSVMTKKEGEKAFILLFSYFGQSSLFLFYYLHSKLDIIENALVQPLGFIINPYTMIAIGIVMATMSLYSRIRDSWKYAVMVGILLGILSQTKVYAGIAGISALLFYGVYVLVRSRFRLIVLKNHAIAIGLTAVLTAITYLPNNFNAGGLIFAPFLYFEHYMQTELLAPSHWIIRKTIFSEHGNIIRIGFLYLEALALFVIVNLGSRLIVITAIRRLFTKTFWKNEENSILTFVIVLFFLIGTFFVQSVSIFDSVQFFWIAVALLGVPAGIIWYEVFSSTKGLLRYAVFVLLLATVVPGVFSFEYRYLFGKKWIIRQSEVSLLKQVATVIPPGDSLIYLPNQEKPAHPTFSIGAPIITGITGRQLYYQPDGIPGAGVERYRFRQKTMEVLQQALTTCDTNTIKKSLLHIQSQYLLSDTAFPCLTKHPSLHSPEIISSDRDLFFYTIK